MQGGADALRKFRTDSPFFTDYWPGDQDPLTWDGIKAKDGKVQVFKLTGTMKTPIMVQEMPASLGGLIHLTSFEITWCKRLLRLPPQIGRCTGLTTLGLAGCLVLAKLPSEIGNLVNLLSLDLAGCKDLTELPAEIGQLTALRTLKLTNCLGLAHLPAAIGRLSALKTLNLSGCDALRELPCEVGQLTLLTTVHLDKCLRIEWPAEEKIKAPLDELVGYLAAHLMVQRREPFALPIEKWLYGRPKALQQFVSHIISNPVHAETLALMVEEYPSLVSVKNGKGERVVELACKEVRRAMESALYLFGRYEVDQAPPLHFSSGAAVVAASDCERPEAKPLPRRALKAMRDEGAVLAELKNRANIDNGFVVPVLMVYVDARVDKLAYEGKVPIERVEGLSELMARALQKRRAYNAGADDGAGRRTSPALPSSPAPTAAAVTPTAAAATPTAAAATPTAAADALPAGWKLAEAPDGRSYYFVSGGSKTQWARPTEPAPGFTPPTPPPPTTSGASGGDGASGDVCEGFKYVLVFRLAERSLATTLLHDRIGGHDLQMARKIATDLAKALDRMHANKRIHADLKPLHVVRNGSTWQLVDLSVSCKIGMRWGQFYLKPPSSAYCPPEMARVLLRASDAGTAPLRLAELKAYSSSSVAYDLWSYGCLLFHLVYGRPMWPSTTDDHLVDAADLYRLAEWNQATRDTMLLHATTHPSADQHAATPLLRDLLDPDPLMRLEHFASADAGEMRTILRHPFFTGPPPETHALSELNATHARAHQEAATLRQLTAPHQAELRCTCAALTHGTPAAYRRSPRSFVVLQSELPSPEQMRKMGALSLTAEGKLIPAEHSEPPLPSHSLDEDGEGEADDEAVQAAEAARAKLLEEAKAEDVLYELLVGRYKEAHAWAERLAKLGEQAGHLTPEAIKSAVGDLIQPGKMFLYLVDELSGQPLRTDGFPLTLSAPSVVVPQLVGALQVGVRAACLANGVQGLARMFGMPTRDLPEGWRQASQDTVERMKPTRVLAPFERVRPAAFDELSKIVTTAVQPAAGQMGACQVGGLQPVKCDNMQAWTALSDPLLLRRELERRAEGREAERRREEESVGALRAMLGNRHAEIRRLQAAEAERAAEVGALGRRLKELEAAEAARRAAEEDSQSPGEEGEASLDCKPPTSTPPLPMMPSPPSLPPQPAAPLPAASNGASSGTAGGAAGGEAASGAGGAAAGGAASELTAKLAVREAKIIELERLAETRASDLEATTRALRNKGEQLKRERERVAELEAMVSGGGAGDKDSPATPSTKSKSLTTKSKVLGGKSTKDKDTGTPRGGTSARSHTSSKKGAK